MLPCERCGQPNDLVSTAWGNLCEDCARDCKITKKVSVTNVLQKKPKAENIYPIVTEDICPVCLTVHKLKDLTHTDTAHPEDKSPMCPKCLTNHLYGIQEWGDAADELDKMVRKYRNTGRRVLNNADGKVGVIIKEHFPSGSIQVMYSIAPLVICTHDTWDNLDFIQE